MMQQAVSTVKKNRQACEAGSMTSAPSQCWHVQRTAAGNRLMAEQALVPLTIL